MCSFILGIGIVLLSEWGFGNMSYASKKRMALTYLGAELSAIDTYQSGQAMWNGSNFGSLVLTAQGAAANGRVGNRISVHSLKSIVTIWHENQGGDSDVVRLLLVLDKQANGVNAGYSDVLSQVSGGYWYHSWPRLDQQERFTILRDQTVDIHLVGVESGAPPVYIDRQKVERFDIRFDTPLLINNNAAAAAVTSLVGNNLFWLVCGQGTTTNVDVSTRVIYSDV